MNRTARVFNSPRLHSLLLALLLTALAVTACAQESSQLQLAPLFGDKMMLQRSARAPVWGTAAPGAQVALALTDGDQSATAIAGPDGHWIAAFHNLKPGGPFTLTVSAKDSKVVIEDVLVGDIWLCSGQSNMEYLLREKDEIAAPEDTELRALTIPRNASIDPLTDVVGHPHWVTASPATRATFTAVGYYFGKKLRKETGVPIGLIHSSWGGTAAELWMPKDALDSIPAAQPKMDSLIAGLQNLDADAARFPAAYAAWEQQYGPLDPGNKGFAAGWADPAFDASDWKTVAFPGDWSNLAIPNGGVVWIRRTIPVPANMAGQDLKITLDIIRNFDTTYFNGEEIGNGGMVAPYFFGNPRNYVIPGWLVKAGDNILAVRVVTQAGKNQAFGFANRFNPKIRAESITAPWVAKVETAFAPLPAAAAAAEPKPPTARRDATPTVMYNAMILPLIPYGIKGVIWYQGESNVNRGYNYRTIFPELIQSWRNKWGIADFPFYFVQIANLGKPLTDPNDPDSRSLRGWAELRESQLVTWQTTPHTGMAVTVDIGDPNNIHPVDKWDVGDRLARIALAQDYGRKMEFSGPVYQSMLVRNSAIRLKFTHLGSGLMVKGDGPLKQFAIAGADQKFYWADARIEGEEVVVSSKDVPAPVAVRYAWSSDPEGLNLYNKEGLPAPPFRTDTWPTPTAAIWW